MKNLIDMSNHILKFSSAYLGEEDVSDGLMEEALALCLMHGDDFCINFTRVYLEVQRDEILKSDMLNYFDGT